MFFIFLLNMSGENNKDIKNDLLECEIIIRDVKNIISFSMTEGISGCLGNE